MIAPMNILRSIFGNFSEASAEENPPKYPPDIKGLPPTTPERLLVDQDALMRRIYQAIRGSEKEYKTLYLPLMRNYASFVHLLPASESHHHQGAGGLLRHGLEVGFWALQQCENAVFALDLYPEMRRQAASRWEFAVFAAGLCHDVGKCVSDMAVVDQSGAHQWGPFVENLYDWLVRLKIDRYHIRWYDSRHGRHEKIVALVLDRVFPEHGRDYLHQVGTDPLNGMIAALNGILSGGPENQIYTMVNKSDRVSVEADIKAQSTKSDLNGQFSSPVVVNLFDAMRQLLRKKQWTVNKCGSRVWFTQGRIFLTWPEAVKDINEQLQRNHILGMPQDPVTIAEFLFDRELAKPYFKAEGEQTRRYWTIIPAILGSPERPQKLTVLELTNPSALLDPAPASGDIQILDPLNDPTPDAPVPEETSSVQQISPAPTVSTCPVPEVHLEQKPKSEPQETSNNKNEDLTDIFQVEFEKQANLDLFPVKTETEELLPPEDTVQDGQPYLSSELEPPPADGAQIVQTDLFTEESSLAGEVMVALAEDIKKNKKKWQRDAILTQENLIAIPYPSVVESYGLPAEEVLQELKEQDWLKTSSKNPLITCMEVENYRSNRGKFTKKTSVILTKEPSQVFLMIAGTTVEEVQQKQTLEPQNEEQLKKRDESQQKSSPPSTRRTKPKKKPNPKKRTQKAALLAGGATLETEAANQKVLRTEDQPSLKARINSILIALPKEINWKEDENSFYATLDNVSEYILEFLANEGVNDLTEREIIGLLNSSGPILRIKSLRRTRNVHIKKGKNVT